MLSKSPGQESAVTADPATEQAQHRVTINDIARQAGVSKTAVSFAFNMPGRLSSETTERILDVARRLGYAPNPIARSLNTSRTNAIGIIVPQDIADAFSNPFFSQLVGGIGQVCSDEGMSLMVIPPMRGSLLDATYAALIDGCIVTGLEPRDEVVRVLRQRNLPFVMIDADAPEYVACVNINDFEGARQSLQHLLRLGHRDIAIASFESFSGKVETYTGTLKHRFDGYRAALKEAGLSLQSRGIHNLECKCSIAGGIEVYNRLMQLVPRPTAVVALSDAIAIGIIETAHQHGLNVPAQLSVVGFDDLEVSKMVRPPLTTVRQPIKDKGRRAAELLLDSVRGRFSLSRHIVLPVELVVRKSTQRLGG
ncbi:MAG: LacI family transcriptional regulator [Chloroflexi bacterium]|nr:LacI family transcriptional regulator [Chloroflexota bacterium]MCL5274534.1 LacI family transcriptional regulator [Chloroflexota bacterium]